MGLLYMHTVVCEAATMIVEISIDSKVALPDGAVLALEVELLRRLSQSCEDCKLTIRHPGANGLSTFSGIESDKETIEEILQKTWECADDWFY